MLRPIIACLSALLGLMASGELQAVGLEAPRREIQAQLDRHVVREMELNQIPGLSLVVVRSGQVVYSRSFGVKDLASGDAMTLDTPVELASLSKSMTALALLLLVEEKRVDLDSPVDRYLVENWHPETSSAVTVRHLLEHKTGITRRADRLLACCEQPGDLDLRLAARRFREARLIGAPGTSSLRPRQPGSFRYANSNYVLLAALVETVSGQTFPRFMRERVFGPLGMDRTTLELSEAQSWGLATLHERIWGRVRVSPSRYRGWWGSSAVKSTSRDLVRYMTALLDGAHPMGSLLSASKLCEAPSGYRFGWHVRPKEPRQTCMLVHSGKIWGANTAIILVPELQLGAAVLINCGVKRAEQIAAAAIGHHLGKEVGPPERMGWSTIPDNWAIAFLLAAIVVFACTVGYFWRGAAQLRRRQRRFLRDVNWLAYGRSTMLLMMSAILFYNVLGQNAWTRPGLPTSAQTAFPLFAVSVGLLLLAAAFLGLAPRRD